MRKKILLEQLEATENTLDASTEHMEELRRELRKSKKFSGQVVAAGRVLKELLEETDAELRLYKEAFDHSTRILAAALDDGRPMLGNAPKTAEEFHHSILELIKSRQIAPSESA